MQQKPWDLVVSFDEEDDKDNDEDNAFENDLVAELQDPLLLLLVKIRKQLMEGDYRALYEVWKKYGYPDDEEEEEEEWPKPPVPEEKEAEETVIAEFAEILDEV